MIPRLLSIHRARSLAQVVGSRQRQRWLSATASSTDLVNCIPKTQQPISSLGFGAYRISPSSPVHSSALRHAVTSGHVNVIDTAAHFGDGASETAIGQLLKESSIDRSTVYIISKAGFVTPHIAQVLAQAQVPTEHVAGISSAGAGVGHAISPAAIKAQLELSLQQLGTDYIDMYMINCPERMLAVTAGTMSAAQLEASLARSIEYLASEVDRGRIRGFGFTSTDVKWALPTGATKAALGQENPPQWHGVQVPANICETKFLAPDFLDQVNSFQLALFTHRLLTAISPLGILRLATTINSSYHSQNLPLLADPAVAGDLDTSAIANLLASAFPRLAQLEETLVDQVDDPDLANKFIWSGVLTDTLDKLLANHVGATHFFTSSVLPTVRSDIAALQAAANSDAKVAVAQWANEYVSTVDQIHTYVTALAHAAAVVRNRESRDLLALYAPGVLSRDAHLPEVCLQLVHGARAHVPGSTLVGMRQSEYVDRMVQVATGQHWVERDSWEKIRESGVLEFIAEGGRRTDDRE
ncbi:NADP-dependent oxidoreductase domain-containing protein [Catenaria anguillulae PL171]|uniref:NADP-dependent oxidoreductase domain-containing protein n=1 Tax=Catenaria anguillulae PL171 TaxID=765915 RepID=A0A1Y2HPU8_9FUNG|nr:NADP-dependent oxidoreductase domain-containing protein [Catenaria anguillulae PL171]